MSRGRVAILSQEGLQQIRNIDPDEHVVRALTDAGWDVEPGVVWQHAMRKDWTGFTAAIVRSTWDYNEDVILFMACLRHIQAQGVLVLNDPERIISWNYDKRYLRRLADAGVPTIPTIFVDDSPSANDESDGVVLAATQKRVAELTTILTRAATTFDGGVVVKPAISLGSVDTFRVPSAGASAEFKFVEDPVVSITSKKGKPTDFGPSAPAPDGWTEHADGKYRWPTRTFQSQAEMTAHVFYRQAALIQPFISTVQSFGEVAVFFFGNTCGHGLLKTPTGGDFRVQSQFGGKFTVLGVEQLRELKVLELAEQLAAKHIGATPLYARFDFVFVPPAVYEGARNAGGFSGVSLDLACVPTVDLRLVGAADGGGAVVTAVPAVIEMELIEPYLFFEHAPASSLEAFVSEFHRQVEEHRRAVVA